MFIGIKETTNEIIIGTPNGPQFCRTIARVPEQQRWDKQHIENARGLPWDHQHNVGEAPKAPLQDGMKQLPPTIVQAEGEVYRRPFKILKYDLENEFGYTHGCPGCICR